MNLRILKFFDCCIQKFNKNSEIQNGGYKTKYQKNLVDFDKNVSQIWKTWFREKRV